MGRANSLLVKSLKNNIDMLVQTAIRLASHVRVRSCSHY